MCSYVLSALEAIAGPKGSDVIDLASTPSGDLPHGTPPMLMIGDAETGKGLPFWRHHFSSLPAACDCRNCRSDWSAARCIAASSVTMSCTPTEKSKSGSHVGARSEPFGC
jgi:hypothetical protein